MNWYGFVKWLERSGQISLLSLLKLTKILTRDRKEDVENLYRRMCFNVFAHNRDDHSKNFAWLYQESARSWRLFPAYDLIFRSSS